MKLTGQLLQLCQLITGCYSEIVHWRRNLFKIPSGKVGEAFTLELARLFLGYGEGSAMETVTIKAAMVLPFLQLQKPYAKSKARDHVNHLICRLDLWLKGEIEELLSEGHSIQHQLYRRASFNNSDPEQHIARTFEKLMFECKVKAAIRLITSNTNNKIANPQAVKVDFSSCIGRVKESDETALVVL